MVIGDLITSPIEGISRYDAFNENIKYIGPNWTDYNVDYKAKYCKSANCSNQILFNFTGTKLILYGFGIKDSTKYNNEIILDGKRYDMGVWNSITISKTCIIFIIENLDNTEHSVCILSNASIRMNMVFIDCDGELYDYYPKGNRKIYLKFKNYGSINNINPYHSIGRIRVFQDNVEVPLSAKNNLLLSDYNTRNTLSNANTLFSANELTPYNNTGLITENNIIIEIDEKYKYLTKIILMSYTNTGGARYSDIYYSNDYNNWKKIDTVEFTSGNQQKTIEFHIISYIGYLVKTHNKLYSIQDNYFDINKNFYNVQNNINKDNIEDITFDDLHDLLVYKDFNNKSFRPLDLFGKLSLIKYN